MTFIGAILQLRKPSEKCTDYRDERHYINVKVQQSALECRRPNRSPLRRRFHWRSKSFRRDARMQRARAFHLQSHGVYMSHRWECCPTRRAFRCSKSGHGGNATHRLSTVSWRHARRTFTLISQDSESPVHLLQFSVLTKCLSPVLPSSFQFRQVSRSDSQISRRNTGHIPLHELCREDIILDSTAFR